MHSDIRATAACLTIAGISVCHESKSAHFHPVYISYCGL